ncbi:hypothetical protein MFM001_46270 [Mycobacterium sp. MFM001]|nr:hypothetical protein MFM001_46270 [Mycobacterium sp. MFM001]
MEGTLSVCDVGDGSCSDPAAGIADPGGMPVVGAPRRVKALCAELIACCSTPEEFA